MANELVSLPNPTNRVGKESEGYARQNANMYAIQTGLDTCEPYDNGEGVITIPAGGVVEISGGLFVIQNDITLTKPNANAAYWIAIDDNGVNGDGVRTASAELVTRPGAWDSARQGCYRSDGRKTLNWVSLGELANLTEENMTPEMNVKGTWTKNLQKGWYYVELASGAGGGNGQNASGQTGGAGGIASLRQTLNMSFFHDGKKTINIIIGGSGWNGGSGGDGGYRSDVNYRGGGGGGGGSGSGESSSFDFFFTGEQSGGMGGNGGSYQNSGGGGGGGGGGLTGGTAGANSTGQSPTNGTDSGYFGGANGGNGGYGASGAGGGGGNGSDNLSAGEGISGATVTQGAGGGGGGQGSDGKRRKNGDVGGYCRIYQLAN